MPIREFLDFNADKLIRTLGSVLPPSELDKIRAERAAHINKFIQLSRIHLRFATRQTRTSDWRQIVSRSYYCAYHAGRAIRYAAFGTYSTDPGDHKRLLELPNDFPERGRWIDFLTKLRADRNTADYDHLAKAKHLENAVGDSLKNASEFLLYSEKYLADRRRKR
jgi:uncharacterized protein (UPF0332 family)